MSIFTVTLLDFFFIYRNLIYLHAHPYDRAGVCFCLFVCLFFHGYVNEAKTTQNVANTLSQD